MRLHDSGACFVSGEKVSCEHSTDFAILLRPTCSSLPIQNVHALVDGIRVLQLTLWSIGIAGLLQSRLRRLKIPSADSSTDTQ